MKQITLGKPHWSNPLGGNMKLQNTKKLALIAGLLFTMSASAGVQVGEVLTSSLFGHRLQAKVMAVSSNEVLLKMNPDSLGRRDGSRSVFVRANKSFPWSPARKETTDLVCQKFGFSESDVFNSTAQSSGLFSYVLDRVTCHL
jgi:hypothetical protein